MHIRQMKVFGRVWKLASIQIQLLLVYIVGICDGPTVTLKRHTNQPNAREKLSEGLLRQSGIRFRLQPILQSVYGHSNTSLNILLNVTPPESQNAPTITQ